MVAGILAIIGAVFSAICSAGAAIISFLAGFVAWWAKTVPWYITLAMLAGVLLFAWGYKAGSGGTGGCHAGVPSGCSCRELACGTRTPHVPRAERTHIEHGTVVSVESTNRFTIEQGGRRKRSREVTMRWIIVNDAQPEAYDALAVLLPVGSAVKIDALSARFSDYAPDTGLPQQEPDEAALETTGETTGEPGLDYDEIPCTWCQGTGLEPNSEWGEPDNGPRTEQCHICLGTKVQRFMKAAPGPDWESWYAEHVKTCKQCSDVSHGPAPLCETAFAKMQEILREGMTEVDCWMCDGTGKLDYPADSTMHLEEREDDCYRCSGTGKWWTSNPAKQRAILAEMKSPIVGEVTTATGANAATELLRMGYATCQDDAPANYKAAESAAKGKRK